MRTSPFLAALFSPAGKRTQMMCHTDISPHWCVAPPQALAVEGGKQGLVGAAPNVPAPVLLLSPGGETFPPAPRPGSEADGPGLSGHDRELQRQIRLSACQEEVDAGRGSERTGKGVPGSLGFCRRLEKCAEREGGTWERGGTWTCCPAPAKSVQLSSALFPCSNRAALHLYSNTLNFQ